MISIKEAIKIAQDFNDSRDALKRAIFEERRETLEALIDEHIRKDAEKGFFTTVISNLGFLEVFKDKSITIFDVRDYISNNIVPEYEKEGYTVSYVNGCYRDLGLSWKKPENEDSEN